MHQSTLYAILAVLASAHAVPMTEEFRVHRRECMIVGGCGPTSLETPGPIIARRDFLEPEPSMEEPGFVAPQKTRSEPLEVDGGASINLVNGEKRMCAGDGCDLPVETDEKRTCGGAVSCLALSPDPAVTPAAGYFLPSKRSVDKRMCAGDGCDLPVETDEKRTCSGSVSCVEPLNSVLYTPVPGLSLLDKRSADKRMCAGDSCDLPIEPLSTPVYGGLIARHSTDKRMCAGDTCGIPIEPLSTPVYGGLIARHSTDKRMCAGDACDLPVEPLDKRVACRLAGAAGNSCEEEPLETPISLPEEPLRADKRIVCPLAADGTTSSECSEPVTTPISLPLQPAKQKNKAAPSFTAVIRPRPAARTAIPLKPRLMPLEVAGEAPIQPAEQLSLNANAQAGSRKRSSTLETNLKGGAVTAHTDADGNVVVNVAGSLPTLTTRVVKPRAVAGGATVAVKGVAPAAAATAGVVV